MVSPAPNSWPESAAREAVTHLPPVRDDEPALLRQDIFDELADHLGCAFRRELLRTNGDVALAEQYVRSRFGDPHAVARRLWLDAMKGKLMAQRILIATCGVVVATCLVFGVLLWRLVDRLDAVAGRPADPEWNPMAIRCVIGSENGPPAEGFNVSMKPVDEANGPGEEQKTGSDGLVDCGLRRPGYYRVTATAPWREETLQVVSVQPGRASETVILCPAEPPPSFDVDWKVTWPEIAKEHDDLWYVISIAAEPKRTIGKNRWNIGRDERLLAFHPDGRAIDLALSMGGPSLPSRARRIVEIFRRPELHRPGGPRAWWTGSTYTVSHAGIYRWNGDGPNAGILANPKAVFRYDGEGGGRWNGFVFGSEAPRRPWRATYSMETGSIEKLLREAKADRANPIVTRLIQVHEEIVAEALGRWDRDFDPQMSRTVAP